MSGGLETIYGVYVPSEPRISPVPGAPTQQFNICAGDSITNIDFELRGPITQIPVLSGAPNGISIPAANFSLGARTVTFTIVTSGAATQTAANEIYGISINGTQYTYSTSASDTIDIVGNELRNAISASPILASVTYDAATDRLTLLGRWSRFSASFIRPATGTFTRTRTSTNGRGSVRVAGTIDPSVAPGIYIFSLTSTSTYDCTTAVVTGSIEVAANPEIGFSPGSTASSTACFGAPITPISFTVTNSTGFPTATGLPPGLTIVANGVNSFSIQGSLTTNPVITTPYNYTITSGASLFGCTPDSINGTIIVQPAPIVTLETDASTLNQLSVCNNEQVLDIEFSVSNPAFFPQLTAGSNLPPN